MLSGSFLLVLLQLTAGAAQPLAPEPLLRGRIDVRALEGLTRDVDRQLDRMEDDLDLVVQGPAESALRRHFNETIVRLREFQRILEPEAPRGRIVQGFRTFD